MNFFSASRAMPCWSLVLLILLLLYSLGTQLLLQTADRGLRFVRSHLGVHLLSRRTTQRLAKRANLAQIVHDVVVPGQQATPGRAIASVPHPFHLLLELGPRVTAFTHRLLDSGLRTEAERRRD